MLRLAHVLVTFCLTAATCASTSFPHITDLVTFGDSYTDEGRLGYFINHNGSAPPVGYVPPISNATSTGGYIWPRIVANNTGVTLHDYAVSGAVCSNELTPRYFAGINAPFPAVQEYEIPAFIADNKAKPVNPATTMFSIWIGTNDLGNGAILTDEHLPGVTLVNVTDCVVDAVQKLYNAGARNFIFQNVAPLQYVPQYALPGRDEVSGSNQHYFPTKPTFLGGNLTAISDRMQELVLTTNQIWKYQLPSFAASLKDAKIAYFDSYNVILDIIKNPHEFLTAPYNTTGYESHCTPPNCTTSYIWDPTHPNGYVWYDELHPSQRTDTIIAEEFAKAMKKQSNYATYYF
ncbi:hypothetical protein FRB94_004723 [Tulasnella sp. JGI-2019a]|nr:hypothetical protein FRB93_011378 [Tulasnella sp. JGI-2019a]KAG9012913.1 hypothetical protein FRB94_004723 [Tulasnella sp. JGI-2019a]